MQTKVNKMPDSKETRIVVGTKLGYQSKVRKKMKRHPITQPRKQSCTMSTMKLIIRFEDRAEFYEIKWN